MRVERDTMGEMRVPDDALYGAQTQRAVENFPISSLRLPPEFIHALGVIKASAARANAELGQLDSRMAEAIAEAADAVARGDYDSQFPIDVYQTGSGTSTNMNANEVIAHLASERLGSKVHPNEHVNSGQSSNDVIPTAIHVSAAVAVTSELLPAMRDLARGLAAKAHEFQEIIKIGRTHLQDAVPMRLGDEFSGYGHQVESCARRLESALEGAYELPLGGTAVGTGLNTHPEFARTAIRLISGRAILPFREAPNHFEAQAAKDAMCFLSGALRTYAVAFTKIANDIRWLGSGPRCGLGELKLPATQPGSSIMPGKVNPVIAESAVMACAQVIGHDATIAWCCAAGNFELNVMMPVIAYDLIDSIRLLAASSRNFLDRLVRGLEADRDRIERYIEQSLALVTALVPEIGYEKSAALAKNAWQTGRTVREVAREKSGIPEKKLNELLDPSRQSGIK
jgi:fumarate hydratase class II